MLHNKKGGFVILWVIVIVVVIGLIVWAIVEHQATTPGQPGTQTAPSSGTTADYIHQYPDGQLPPGMPSDIILASDAKVLNSYSGVTSQGKQQSTIIYMTQESASKILPAYFQYFVQNKWAVNVPEPLSVSASKDNQEIMARVSLATSSLTVFITLLQ